MQHIKINLFLLILFFTPCIVCGQVTIGSSEEPSYGAILDLKEKSSTNQITSTKGLLLPRVTLSDMKVLKMGDNKIEEDAWLDHTGLIVYNTQRDNCTNIMPGVYSWIGNEWIPMGQAAKFAGETKVLTDIRGTETVKYHIGRFKSETTDAGWWMLENVKATKWSDGTDTDLTFTIPSTTNENVDKDISLYTYPMANPSLVSEHGYFYNYPAASKKTPAVSQPSYDKVQGICPTGWHLPTQDDWKLLFRVIEENPCEYSHSTVNADYAGNAQKMGATPLGKSRSMEQGGFNAVLSGAVYGSGYIADIDSYGYYWNSFPTMISGYEMLGSTTFVSYTATQHGDKHTDDTFYLPVRCVKDTE